MKLSSNRAIAFVAISSFILLTVTSCSKSNNNSSSAGISATVTGSAWVNSYPVEGIFYTSAGELDILGAQIKSGDTTGIGVTVMTPITLNSPVDVSTSNWDISYINSKTQAEYDGGNASSHSTITVTSWDSTGHKIGGTFSGVLYNNSGGSDSVIITNGKFNSTFQVQ